ncbi:PAS domain S-box protein [Dyadobacter sp. NIV53]|uniref:PAS domain S-box protein n=1 Tax=Dyadobacter sp. NIV53 TaxID=2861765 RepID=UPI001C86E019|nr:PAS domain S-box protein [Dyadobacter sp. NIV53]
MIKILHIEDMPSDALLIKNALDKSKIPYQGLVVDTRIKFIAALTEFSPDIILCDHSLPSFNSTDALKIVRQNTLDIPFVIITATMSDESAVDLIMKGADDYILKDRLSRLPIAILNALEKFRLKKEHQKFLDALISSEKRYRALVEHSTDGVIILDALGKPTFVSPSVKNVLGYEQSEVEAMDLYTIMHPDDTPGVRLMLKKILDNPGKTIKGHTGRMLHRDGSWRWIEATVTNLLNDPAVNGIVDNFRDVTEKRISEQLMIDSEEKYRLLFETSMDGILLTRQNGQVLAANQAACNIFEMTQDEIITVGRSGLTDVNDPALSLLLNERDRTGKSGGEITMLRMDGSRFAGEVSLTVFKTAHGNENTSMIIRDVSNRKKADENDRFQANLLNTIGQAIIYTDLSGVINYWNQAARQIYGWTTTEVLGKNISEIIPSMATGHQISEIQHALQQGHTWSGEFNKSRKNGSYFPALVNYSPVYDQNQELSGMVSISSDITEKRALERLLDKATNMARIGSYEIDLVNNLIFWSPMTKQIHEVETDYIPETKTNLIFFKAGYSRNAITAAVDQALQNQTYFDLELQIITARGNHRWVRVIGEAELVGGKCILYGSFQDIDKMKKTELEVLRAYEDKNIILESIGDAFFAVDKDWVVNYWNKEAARLLAQTKDNVLNRNLWEVFSESRESESYTKYTQAVNNNQIVHFEDYYQPLDRWLEVSAYPSANGLSVFFKDISERKLSEKKLRELNSDLQQYTNELVLSNKGLEQFSYMVSHNLRAPVANIIGLAGLLGEEDYPEDVRKDFLDGIQENVMRLDNVIGDLNTILQVKRQVGEKNKTVNLQLLVDNIKSSIDGLILKENVQIITDFSAKNEFVALRTYLHSIFYNLIINSIKYHQSGLAPVMEIRSAVSGRLLTISFKDNGMGIDLVKNEGQVFGLYKRFHQHVEGKGMGLFMVRTQVEILGGTVSVSSEVNKGTEFLIRFQI